MSMRSGETILAAYSSRSRVVRGLGGIEVSWGVFRLEMSEGEFSEFAAMLSDGFARPARCGEVSRCFCGRIHRSPMGEVSVLHDRITLWFAPDEFEEFGNLVLAAKKKLGDLAPPPKFGVPWEPREASFGVN